MQKTNKAWLHLASRLLRSKKHLTIPPNHPTHTHTHTQEAYRERADHFFECPQHGSPVVSCPSASPPLGHVGVGSGPHSQELSSTMCLTSRHHLLDLRPQEATALWQER